MTVLLAGSPSEQDTDLTAPPGHERARFRARDEQLLQLRRADPKAGLAAAEYWLSEVEAGGEAEAWGVRAYPQALRATGSYAQALACYVQAEALFDRLGLSTEVARSGL